MTRPASLLLAAAALMCSAAPSAAQALHGRVTDASTGAPIAGVRLALLDPAGTATATARSAPDGAFRLAAPAPGAYRVSAHGAGYRVTLTRVVELATAGDTEAELRMAPATSSFASATPLGRSGPGVHGRVVDDETGRPVPGAAVTLRSSRGRAAARVVADGEGVFTVRPPSGGAYVLEAAAEGFLSSASGELTLAPAQSVELELRVSKHSILLAPVEVVASSAPLMRDAWRAEFDWRRGRAIGGRFLGPDELARLPVFNATDALREIPFVQVRGRGWDQHATLRLRLTTVFAGERCAPNYYVDGVRVRMAGSSINEYVQGTSLTGVEVYDNPAMAPPEFPAHENDRCGVIVLWTGRSS